MDTDANADDQVPSGPASRRYRGLVSVPDPLPSSRPTGRRAPAAGVPGRRPSGARLAALVYDGIKESLLEGDHQAGERLSVEQIAQAHAVSKQPVMDALRRLSIDGLVEIIPQVGVEVARYDPEEIEDFFELFASVEATAAGLAATRRTDAQLRELDTVGARIEALTHADDPATRSHGYRVANREYHGVIHTMAHSRIIVDYAARLWDLSDFLINTGPSNLPLHSALEQRHADHEAVRAALHEQDPDAAGRHMKKHILDTVGIIRAEASDRGVRP
jgi:DNA-binding GntR family transcriptional regulator